MDERRASGRAIEVLCGQKVEIYPSKDAHKVVVVVRMNSAISFVLCPTRSVIEFSHGGQVTQRALESVSINFKSSSRPPKDLLLFPVMTVAP